MSEQGQQMRPGGQSQGANLRAVHGSRGGVMGSGKNAAKPKVQPLALSRAYFTAPAATTATSTAATTAVGMVNAGIARSAKPTAVNLQAQDKTKLNASSPLLETTTTTAAAVAATARFRPSQMILDLRASAQNSSSAAGWMLKHLSAQNMNTGIVSERKNANAAAPSVSVSTLSSAQPQKSSLANTSQIHGGMRRPSTIPFGRTSVSVQGSAASSSRWISGVLVKDAGCQTVEQFNASEYQSVDWNCITSASHPPSLNSESGEDEEYDGSIEAELRSLQLRKHFIGVVGGVNGNSKKINNNRPVYTTPAATVAAELKFLTPISNAASSSSVLGSPTPPARCKAPDADQLLSGKFSEFSNAFNNIECEDDGDKEEKQEYSFKEALNKSQSTLINKHIPPAWFIAAPPSYIIRPTAHRAGLSSKSTSGSESSLTVVADIPLSTGAGKSKQQQQQHVISSKKQTDSSSCSIVSGASSTAAIGYTHSRVNLLDRGKQPIAACHYPSTPISEQYSSTWSEDDSSSSIASSSLQTLMSSIGSPDSSKVVDLCFEGRSKGAFSRIGGFSSSSGGIGGGIGGVGKSGMRVGGVVITSGNTRF
ncbi:hypothetical protein HK100_008437 [Physocladia obscura]|uniref:Uncharacterized protein n=1 Tax=Physocladia obscura TaxID=109957 RepID=A0AAD5XH90_9FUNG|nr:hypothetical protein HK100_008437 [Physocladia obscura]